MELPLPCGLSPPGEEIKRENISVHKSDLTNLIAFSDLTSLDEGVVVDNVCLRKVFNTVSHNGPTEKVMKYGLVSGQ